MPLVLRFSLLFTLFHGRTDEIGRALLSCIATLAMISERFLRNALLWSAFVFVLVWRNLEPWYLIDNHQYLIMYWCFACGLCCVSRNPAKVLDVNARLLVGLCFALATFWKLAGQEYLSGSFLEHTLMSDKRFESFTSLACGIPRGTFVEARRQLGILADVSTPDAFVTLGCSPCVRVLARALSYWTILIEGSLGLVFLLLPKAPFYFLRHALLLIFLFTTYALVPVPGFATLLATMGIAHSQRGSALLLPAYVGAVLLAETSWIFWR